MKNTAIHAQQRRSILAATLLAAMLTACQSAQATTYYWDTNDTTAGSGAATGTWDTATTANWTTDPTGSSTTSATTTTTADDLFFSAGTTGTTGTVTVSGTQAANSITFDDAVAVTLSGGTGITLGGTTGAGIFQTGNAANVISTGLTLGSTVNAFNFSNSTASLLTIGAVTGSATTGTQTVTVGSSSTGGITLNGIIGNGAGGGNVALAINNTSTGVTTLSGVNTYTGGTTITAGILSVADVRTNQNLGASTSGVTLNGGTLKTTHTANANGNFGSRTVTVGASGGTLNVAGAITTGQNARVQITTANTLLGSGALAITGTGGLDGFGGGKGAVVINAAQTYSGAITLSSGGLLALEGGGTAPLGSGATIAIGNNAELSIGTGITVNNNVTVTGGTASQMSWNNGGAGILAGTLTLNANLRMGMRNWYNSTAQNGTVSGVVSGTGTLTIAEGTGTLTLSGANTYTGKTSIQIGALSVASLNSVSGGTGTSNLGAPVTIANGTIDIGATTVSGTLIYTGAGETTDRVLNLAGTTGGATITQSGTSGLLKFSSALTATGAGAKTLTLQGSTAGTGEIAGAIVNSTGTTSVAKAGTGLWTLSGANTYTGATTVNAGTLTAGSTNAFGSNSAVTLANTSGVTLNLNGNANTIGSLAGGGTTGGNVTLGSATVTIGGNNTSTSFAGVVSGTGGLIKTGSGTQTLSGTNTYTGTTTINAGTLALGANNVLADTSNVILGGGTLAAATFSDTIGTLSLTANSAITLGTGSSLVFADSNALDWTSHTLSITGTFTDSLSIRFGTNSSGLSSTQLALISINGSSAFLDSSGFLTTSAIPEPATYATLFGAVALVGAAVYRRRRQA